MINFWVYHCDELEPPITGQRNFRYDVVGNYGKSEEIRMNFKIEILTQANKPSRPAPKYYQ